jgi:dipeptidyl aminopeptidase/acylaminoacyl peptidase
MRHIVVAAACIGTLAACHSDSPAGPPVYEPLPPPPLEALPFDRVGSGTFVFMRDASGPSAYSAAYVIDGSGRRSFPALGSSGRIIDAPSVAPDGRRIAFLGYSGEVSAAYDVYVANLDGTDERRVATFQSNSEGPPSWTPNGSQIAFVVDSGGAASIYRQSPVSSPTDRVLLRKFTVAADGSLVCPFMFSSEGPISVSVDGAIALNCLGREIDVVEADGRVTAAYTASAQPAGHLSVVHSPAWSPDGERLALVEEIRETSGFETVGTSVIVVEPSVGVSTVLATVATTGAGAGRLTNFAPFSLCWLPDGSGIMFTAAEGPTATHIFIVAVQSGVVTRVTSAPNVFDRSVSCSR